MDRKLQFEPHTLVEVGQILTVEPPLSMCVRGLHASGRAIDALHYAPGPIVCRVEVSGEIITDPDKVCASHRRCVWLADATEVLHEFACRCAEMALDLIESRGVKVDPRNRAAVAAKRRWLKKEISDQQLAYAAADAAAADAAARAYAAADAVRAYAVDAAAADAAARAAYAAAVYVVDAAAAAYAAYAVAAAANAVAAAAANAAYAARADQNKVLETMLLELEHRAPDAR